MAETVLFTCPKNAGRSQLSCALFNLLADPEKAKGVSAAGVAPAEHVHPVVVEVLKEVGIDVGANKPQEMTPELAQAASVVVAHGPSPALPEIPGLNKQEMPLPDPNNQPIEEVRKIRDEVAEQIKELVAKHGWGKDTA